MGCKVSFSMPRQSLMFSQVPVGVLPVRSAAALSSTKRSEDS